jgi:DNA-binding GntR family transcriptional regulator
VPDETGASFGVGGTRGRRGQRSLLSVEGEVPAQRAASGVLADRIAAALVHREPGWQLPRRSALARRYNVSMAEIDAAIGELIRRSLIRRLPDGQLYRASPAEYLIPIEGVAGLSTRVDPMGGEITCQARHVSHRDAPQDVAWTLGVAGETQVRIIRCVWAIDGEPAAISTAYVPRGVADAAGISGTDEEESFQSVLDGPPDMGPGIGAVLARAVDVELSPPQPSVARSLRLLPGLPAISVIIRFDDRGSGEPVGLTVVTVKPDRFRIVVQAGDTLPRGIHLAD